MGIGGVNQAEKKPTLCITLRKCLVMALPLVPRHTEVHFSSVGLGSTGHPPPHCLFPFPFAHKGRCLHSTLHGGSSRQKCLQLRGCDHTKAAYLKVVCAGTARGHHPTDVDREQGGYPGEAISLQGTRNQVRDCIGLPFKISSSAVQR